MNFVCVVFNLKKEELKCYTRKLFARSTLELLKVGGRKNDSWFLTWQEEPLYLYI